MELIDYVERVQTTEIPRFLERTCEELAPLKKEPPRGFSYVDFVNRKHYFVGWLFWLGLSLYEILGTNWLVFNSDLKIKFLAGWIPEVPLPFLDEMHGALGMKFLEVSVTLGALMWVLASFYGLFSHLGRIDDLRMFRKGELITGLVHGFAPVRNGDEDAIIWFSWQNEIYRGWCLTDAEIGDSVCLLINPEDATDAYLITPEDISRISRLSSS